MFKKKWKYIVITLSLILFTSLTFFTVDIFSPAIPNESAIISYEKLSKENKDGYTKFPPQIASNNKGIILYTGAKVPSKSYTYLAEAFTKQGYTVFFSDFFLNYAFFNIDLAQKIIDENTDINAFVLSGHSLGGAMVGKFLSQKQNTKISHVIFLASYSIDNISSLPQKMLSLSAERDGNTTRKKIAENKANLPTSTQFTEITGGNHRYFANYTYQKGDLDATISSEMQQAEIVQYIAQFLTLS